MADWTKRHSLEGKRALITGATKGIGFEACQVLADAGADIIAVGRDEKGLADVVAAVTKLGRRCVPISAGLATVEGPKAAAAIALKEFGTIDILVNNAGVTTIKSIINKSWQSGVVALEDHSVQGAFQGDPMKAKIPANRFGRTVEVADLILFLTSSASDLINGQDILIDGGFTAQ
jgi:NAD(P)-dependent dehydrogenase (short-subunit alcohol dehydrogenase family)